MERLPLVYRFQPTDDKLIFFYLRRKIDNEPLPIKKCNLYSDKNSWELFDENSTGFFDELSSGHFYHFAKLKKKSKAKIESVD
ncbi:hypothetical protein MANES_17G021625v8 [Manihot esculenta]|uniref:NAC transcription factors 45 n=2 Tax=Manihot esculenta TaxID=3983 RepID=A0A0M4FET5_MANES|nr:NAC transcription factors 45 [Manihot esculenta]KAG8634236.1 hypothetical protein MANES_17G021625v8 [Manihot esculenta]